VEVVGHKAHGAVPQPGSVVIARVRSPSNHQSSLLLCQSFIVTEYRGGTNGHLFAHVSNFAGLSMRSIVYGLQFTCFCQHSIIMDVLV
jgi:exosome complex RNA-binding protein Csl4